LSERDTVTDLELLAAQELAAFLSQVAVGASLPTDTHPPVFTTLEYLMTAILRRDHSEWKHEDIDGLQIARAIRSGTVSAKMLGTCILITDQSVTPFALEIRLGDPHTIHSLRLRLGEPGTGQLGISGPACESSAAATLRMGLALRLDEVDWTYDISL
jgi:hypothetical protein